MSPAVPLSATALGSPAAFAVPLQTGDAPANGGMAAFLGFTALVLTGFLVLARLSQRVVDDAEEADRGDGLRVPAGPGPGEIGSGSRGEIGSGSERERDESAGAGRSGPARSADADAAETADAAKPAGASESADASEPADAAKPRDAAASRPKDADTGGSEDTVPPGLDRYDPDESESSSVEHGPSSVGSESSSVEPRSGTGATPSGDLHGEVSIPPTALLANVALTQGLFGGVLAAAAWFFQVPATALGLAGGRVEGLAAVGVGLAFGVALWVGNELASALADAAGAGYDEGLRQLLAPADARGWAVLLGGVLPIVAVVEEFLFRAAAVGAASAAFGGTGAATAGVWALAVVSSLAFALGHGAQGRVGVVVTGALGFVLAAGFVVSGSFVVVVVAHYVVNALEFLLHERVGLPDPVWS